MNDFTKKELETIHACLDLGKFDDDSDEASSDDALLNKIESMIDNYDEKKCNHEFKEHEIKIKLCNKCNRFKFIFSLPNGEIIEN